MELPFLLSFVDIYSKWERKAHRKCVMITDQANVTYERVQECMEHVETH